MRAHFKTVLKSLVAIGFMNSLAVSLPANAQTEDAKPVPIDYFAVLPTMTNVQLSPDGKYLAYRFIPAKNANAVIQVLKVDDMSAAPFTAGSSKMDIQTFQWIGNDSMWVNFRQQVRENIIDTNQGVYENRSATLSQNDDNWTFKQFRYTDLSLEARLLKAEPNRVIVSTGKVRGGLSEGQAITEALTPDYYYMDIKTHRLQLKAKAGSRIGGFTLDRDGDIRAGSEFDPGSREVIFYVRDKGSDEWRQITRWPALDDAWSITPIADDPLDINKFFVLSNQGHNTTGVYLMDLRTGELEEEIYRREDGDIAGGWFSSDPNKPGHIAGFVFYEEGERKIAWIDPEEQALFEGIQAALPGKEITISNRSMDGSKMVIFANEGEDPGSYYLLNDGAIQKIGSQNPLLKPEDLGDVSFIRWTSRDGKSIPGYLTTPPRGEPPFPLIVLPHGGPEVPEHITYDEWGQMLANNGYMVLQPGYRGTTRYGLEHAAGIYKDWGGKPQDDKDDGALHLVRQGLVDPDRIAMFGWSYGGYAAMMATIREPQIYQCAIAGAGVSDLDAANAEFSGNRITRDELKRTREGGISPVDHVEDANIPVLVVHGEHDQRVQINQSDWFVGQLKKHNKPHKYIVLEDADHFSNTINYENAKILYTEMLSFLKNDCGPGGL
ncbi:MAG: S9 family peptidase [Henriciella sp.]|nr:S9 family peptidase [Henriciella sp.]MBO6695922.1 S9 family peptidase [Henriciella sp.]